MEKRLRSSLKTSADEFISSAVKLTLKSSKPSLKTIIYAVKPSSDLSSSLPLALHNSILQHTESFQKLVEDDDDNYPYVPSPSNSPSSKRQRFGSVPDSDLDKRKTVPKGINEVKLISSGKILENNDCWAVSSVRHHLERLQVESL